MREEDESDLGEISDLSERGNEIDLGSLEDIKVPPAKGLLERETGKLKSKYKILKKALIEGRLAKVNQELETMGEGRAVELAADLATIDERQTEVIRVAAERKRLKTETILAEYKARIQEIFDEKQVSHKQTWYQMIIFNIYTKRPLRMSFIGP